MSDGIEGARRESDMAATAANRNEARRALRAATIENLLSKHAHLTIRIHEATTTESERDLRAMRLMIQNEIIRRTNSKGEA
jgi:hypothetical protein